MSKVDVLLSSIDDHKALAAQLRLPMGETGKKVAEKMNEVNLAITELAYAALDVQPFDQVLEIGFGNGKLLGEILSKLQDGKMYGIDMSETMAAEAIERNKQWVKDGQLSLVVGSTQKLPYGDNSFNKIVTVNTLYFWANPHAEAMEIYRTLKPNGKLVVGIRSKNTMKIAPFTQFGFTMYDSGEAEQLFRNAGFSNVTSATYPDGEMEAVIVTADR